MSGVIVSIVFTTVFPAYIAVELTASIIATLVAHALSNKNESVRSNIFIMVILSLSRFCFVSIHLGIDLLFIKTNNFHNNNRYPNFGLRDI